MSQPSQPTEPIVPERKPWEIPIMYNEPGELDQGQPDDQQYMEFTDDPPTPILPAAPAAPDEPLPADMEPAVLLAGPEMTETIDEDDEDYLDDDDDFDDDDDDLDDDFDDDEDDRDVDPV